MMTRTNAAPYLGCSESREKRWCATPQQITTRKNEMVARSAVKSWGQPCVCEDRGIPPFPLPTRG
mgnify:CR=1 FL=1